MATKSASAIANPPAESPVKGDAASLAGKAASIADTVKSELSAVNSAYSAFFAALQAVGPLGMESLASSVGQTVDKLGSPAFGPWQVFCTALVARKSDYKTHDRLFRMACNAVGGEGSPLANESKETVEKARERFVTSKSRAKWGATTATLRMKAPAAWDIQLG